MVALAVSGGGDASGDCGNVFDDSACLGAVAAVGSVEISVSPELGDLLGDLRTVDGPADPAADAATNSADSAPADPLDPDWSALVDAAAIQATDNFAVDPLASIKAEIADLRGRLTIREKLAGQISAASINVERAAASVLVCESVVEEAKGDLKSAKERYDQAVNALREIVRDVATGQGRLDFDAAAAGVELVDDGETVTAKSLDASPESSSENPLETKPQDPAITAAVCELGKKLLRNVVGAEAFDRAKDSEEPIGLTDKQVEVVESEGCVTIADLERKLRESPLFLQDLKGFGESAQNRLTASLMAWRKVFPHVEG